ncbi:MAG: site-specific DNA-methyltransferase [Gammaproteobacteria bacterium]|nr:site-specific DNA-methyltransferase [Gammaproteobacteria bacterium]
MRRTKTSAFGTTSRIGHDASKFYAQRLYQDIDRLPDQDVVTDENVPDQLDVIHCADSRSMYHLPDRSIHLMITSPPYNVGKEYDQDLSLKEYIALLGDVLEEVYRVLVKGGRMCVNIANVGRKPYIPLHLYLMQVALDTGFLMRGEIVWDKGASAGASCAWGSWQSARNPTLRDVHEYVLIFSKGSYKRTTGHQDSIGREEFLEWSKSVWRVATVRASKFKHPAPFPVELPLRLIHFYSFEDDVVLDPFMGSGTTAEAALLSNRRFVGYEINEEYVKTSSERLHVLVSPNS